VTVSEYSKSDILKYYNVPKDKIKVVYQAAEKDFHPMSLSEDEKTELKTMFGSPKHIIMYLGMIENRKNIAGILKIADQVIGKDKEIKFLLIGKIGYGGQELLKEIQKRENVIYLSGVDE